MKKKKNYCMTTGLSVLVVTIILFAGTGFALDVSLNPAQAQREVGSTIRVHINALNAVDLISYGVKVSFNPAVLTVDNTRTAKNTDPDTGFVFVDPDTGTQYLLPGIEIDPGAVGPPVVPGSVTMIGGRLTPISGNLLLGWITFNVIGLGDAGLSVEVAKDNPNPAYTFDNFVGTDGGTPVAPVVYDDTLGLPAQKGRVYVVAGACYADQDGDGDVDAIDKLRFTLASPSVFPAEKYSPVADIDGDGDVDALDKLRFTIGSPRFDCPVYP